MRAKLPHTEGILDRDGIAIHYEIYGDGPDTILFVPTWSIVHSRVYKAQIPYFSDRFRVITYDPRGNGKSGRPDDPQGYSLEAAMGDGLAVLDAANVDRAILFGLSLSGLVISAIAAFHPDRVRALISIAGWTSIVPNHPWRGADFENPVNAPVGWQKYNRQHWQSDYGDFCEFFIGEMFNEPHSTKQIEDAIDYARGGDGEMLAMTQDARAEARHLVNEDMYRRIRCPVLAVHGSADMISPVEMSRRVAELTGGELVILPDAGHCAQARYPAKVNTLVRDFLARHLGTWQPQAPRRRLGKGRKALYLSSPIGLGHARRDMAITRELRSLHPELQVDWLAQDPVTRLLDAGGESLHPGSRLLASETDHIEAESGEHDLNAFQAIRSMDEILIKNFMVFQEAVEEGDYDLVIADEAWDVDHYWHEHPELKKTQVVWLTDFVGWVAMPEGGDREACLTTDYNAEMIGHIERAPTLRDRAIFVGNPDDIVPLGFGRDLPAMRDWVPKHFDFSGYVIGAHPDTFGPRETLRAQFGYREDEKVCIVTVGGSGVGAHLIRRVLAAYAMAKEAVPALRMIVVTGPRIDPAALTAPPGVEFRAFVPDLDRHLACCNLALVQGGLTTCMELAAAGTPFLYFPLRNHFEQNVHVANRLETYGAGRKMIYDDSSPRRIAEAMAREIREPRTSRPVESGGAARAAGMIAELL